MLHFFKRKSDDNLPKAEFDEELLRRCRPCRLCREDYVRMPVESNCGWVKDAGRRAAILADYDLVREAMTDFVDSEIEPRVNEKHREQFARDLFPDGERDDHADFVMSFELAAYMACKVDKNTACERAIGDMAAAADSRSRLLRELFSTYRFTVIHVLRLQPGFGFKCRDLLLGREVYVIDRSGGSALMLKNAIVATGLFQFGEHFVCSGCLTPLFGISENRMMDTLDLLFRFGNMPTERPVILDSKKSFSLAFALFTNAARGELNG